MNIILTIIILFLAGCGQVETTEAPKTEQDKVKECEENGGKVVRSPYDYRVISGCQYDIGEEDKEEWNRLDCDRWYRTTSSTCGIYLKEDGNINWELREECDKSIHKCWFIGKKYKEHF